MSFVSLFPFAYIILDNWQCNNISLYAGVAGKHEQFNPIFHLFPYAQYMGI